jgi:hypothetical protein
MQFIGDEILDWEWSAQRFASSTTRTFNEAIEHMYECRRQHEL